MTVCFCTLAIHEPYRRRARLLCADTPAVPWVVLTDEPDDFAGLSVRAIRHAPTGPMAADYLVRLSPTGEGRGAAAYHDKRFAILAALQDFDTAIYIDAASRIAALPRLKGFPAGISVLPVVQKSIAEHLSTCGSWRLPAFTELAIQLTGDNRILRDARWCHEALIAVTKDKRESLFFAARAKDKRESRFFEAWSFAAEFLQAREVYSGEGGVIGIAAAYAGWKVNFKALRKLDAATQHEGGGPKVA
jgi:hypothetical protein